MKVAMTSDDRNVAIDFRRLSKFTARVLRHEPWLYELELDEEGWVALGEFLSAVRAERPGGRSARPTFTT